jgi:hypothetical protein
MSPDLAEYYKSRAKEFRERYESMRTLEWQTLLQTYAGYAALAVAGQKLEEKFPGCTWTPHVLLMSAILIFFGVMHYLHYRIEERLITFDETYLFYLKQAYGQGENKESVAPTLGHRYFWTYDMQMTLSALTAMGLLLYEAIPPNKVVCGAGWYGVVVLMTGLLAVLIVIMVVERFGRLGRLLDGRQAHLARNQGRR